MSRALLLVAVIAACLALWLNAPQSARAHPQANDTINRYIRIELYEGVLHLHYVLDYAEMQTLLWEFNNDIESDGNVPANVREENIRNFQEEISAGLSVRFDGEELVLRPLDGSLELFDGDIGLRVLRVAVAFEAPLPADVGFGELVVEDNGRAGWRAITVRPSPGAVVDMDPSLTEDPSHALTLFPDEWLQFPPMMRSVTLGWDPGSGSAAPGTVELDRWKPANKTLTSRLLAGEGPWWLLAFGIVAAFAIGVADAIGPGHGKTVVGSYLAGSGARRRDALTLGAVAGGTHTAIVISLAVGAIAIGPAIIGGDATGALSGAAGAVLVLVGGGLVWHHLRHQSGEHSHPGAANSRGLLGAGMAAGMAPCPASVLIMLAAIGRGDVLYGIALIGAFGLGMAVVLVAVGLAVAGAGQVWKHARLAPVRESRMGTAAVAALPVASGGIVVMAGMALVLAAVLGTPLPRP